MRRAAAGLLVLLLAACGEGLSGQFHDELGVTRYEFEPGGSVWISAAGVRVEADYEIKGERIVVQGPHGTLVLRREGSELHGPMGLILYPADNLEKSGDDG